MTGVLQNKNSCQQKVINWDNEQDKIRFLYIEKKWTLESIADHYGVSKHTVWMKFVKWGLSRRSTKEARKLAKKPTYTPEGYKSKCQQLAEARKRITEQTKKELKTRFKNFYKNHKVWNNGKKLTVEHRKKLNDLWKNDERRNLFSRIRMKPLNELKSGLYRERKYGGWKWRKIRLQVFNQDNWTCQKCGTLVGINQIRANCHHINEFVNESSNNLENLITLCVKCHMLEHKNINFRFI